MLAENVDEVWMLTNDFNDIMNIAEKKGGVIASATKCNLFRDRIDECKLMDLSSSGSKFTWKGLITMEVKESMRSWIKL